jgi:Family of unknown function (DUF5723)
MLRKLIPLFLYLFTFSAVFAQQELGLHFMSDIWQSSKTNPAFIAQSKIHFSIPSFYYNISHTGASYNDFVITNDNGENVLDIGAVIDQMADQNQLFTSVETETFSFSIGLKNFNLSFNHAIKFNTFLDYPKELVQLAWNGNSQFVGQTIDVGPDLQAFAYNEFGIGVAAKIFNISAGAKLKILTGIGDLSTQKTKAQVYTDPDIYQLTFTTDYLINTSSFFKYNGGDNFEIDFGDVSFNDVFASNIGTAIDLGATFKIKNIDVSASIIDLGFISWKKNTVNYYSQGTYTYKGVDISGIIRGDSISFEGALDSIGEVLDFKETNRNYTTMLPTKVYLSASYDVGTLFTFGGLFYTEMYRGKVYPSIAASARAKFGNILSIGATYAVRNKTYDNIGLNATVKLGPVQLFGVSDNIISAFRPYDSRNANLRFGLNLMFK